MKEPPIDPTCPAPFTPEASGIDPDEMEDEEQMTDKPFPTPQEFSQYVDYDYFCKAYTALHEAYEANEKAYTLLESAYELLNQGNKELQQQLEAEMQKVVAITLAYKRECNEKDKRDKRIAELEAESPLEREMRKAK